MENCWTSQVPKTPADQGCLCLTASPHFLSLSSRHVQDTLLEEDTYLMVGTDEQHHTCEQLKVRIPGTAWLETGLALWASVGKGS